MEQSRLRLRKAVTMMFLEQKDVLSAAQWQQFLAGRDEWRRERRQRLAPRPPAEQRPVEPPPDR
jgi:hypothetical protein